MSIGETLAKARQEAGLTVTQVSKKTRIRETVISAIERDDFTSCGGDFYARGHIRSIARAVGTESEALIDAYDKAHGGAPHAISAAQALEPGAPVNIRERRAPNWSAAMALALVVIVVYGIVQVLTGNDPQSAVPASQPPAAAQPAAPALSPSPSPPDDSVAMAPRQDVQVQVKAKSTSWLNVRDAKGKQLFSGLMHSGDVREWTAKKQIRMIIGNGGGVTLTVNGKNLGSPGSGGQVLRLTFGPDDPETG